MITIFKTFNDRDDDDDDDDDDEFILLMMMKCFLIQGEEGVIKVLQLLKEELRIAMILSGNAIFLKRYITLLTS